MIRTARPHSHAPGRARRFGPSAALVCLVLLVSAPAAHATPPSDPRAVKVAQQVMESLGGKKKWDSLVGLQWTFGAMVNDTVKSSRRHAWNKMTGWHRVDYTNAAGDKVTLIHKVGSRDGRAWVNGTALAGDSLQHMLTRAERIWTNDTYWLLMPYKMLDPGVMLTYDGEKKLDGRTYDVLSMTFDHVGQTPGDHYWVYVDRANHRVERWDMVLEGTKPPADTYTWADWVQSGGLWFSTAHRQEHVNVFTKDVAAVASFPPGEFTKL